jgi:hypothetical protein
MDLGETELADTVSVFLDAAELRAREVKVDDYRIISDDGQLNGREILPCKTLWMSRPRAETPVAIMIGDFPERNERMESSRSSWVRPPWIEVHGKLEL